MKSWQLQYYFSTILISSPNSSIQFKTKKLKTARGQI
ncbi:MAG: hypothetical protein ACI8VT_004483 [Saprospiraceae bacterium]